MLASVNFWHGQGRMQYPLHSAAKDTKLDPKEKSQVNCLGPRPNILLGIKKIHSLGFQ